MSSVGMRIWCPLPLEMDKCWNAFHWHGNVHNPVHEKTGTRWALHGNVRVIYVGSYFFRGQPNFYTESSKSVSSIQYTVLFVSTKGSLPPPFCWLSVMARQPFVGFPKLRQHAPHAQLQDGIHCPQSFLHFQGFSGIHHPFCTATVEKGISEWKSS